MRTKSFFQVGAKVKFKNPADDAERNARFLVIEDKGDRVNIQLLDSKMPFPPVECVNVRDIEAS